MSIIAKNISKHFDSHEALKHISFSIDKGEIFGMIGPDGAGKTTLFRILVTLLLSDDGHATLNGLDVRKDYKKIRKIIGYMAGRFSLYMDLSVKENLQFYATVFGTTVTKNYDLIEDVYNQIKPFENRLAGQLSGGMKQKLALSCALIHRPDILILDEPTTGVDAVSRKEFWEMLHKIRKKGITILVSTPYMDEAAQCDRVGLIQKGRLLSVSKPDGLSFDDGTKLYKFSADGNIYEYLEMIRGVSSEISAFMFGDNIHILCPNDCNINMLKQYLTQKNLSNVVFNAVEPDIEDYFMYLLTEK